MEKTTCPNFIANDYFVTPSENFVMITGPNMSGTLFSTTSRLRVIFTLGKTTFLKQVCQLTILAHIGSFIPAEFATIRLTDRLFARISGIEITA